MNWYKKAVKSEKPENYEEMEKWFEERTNKHIERVQKYCKKIEEYNPAMFKGLIEQGKIHDQSKLEDPEKGPYIYVTWKYKCKDNGIKFECPDDMDDKMNEATEHHIKNNCHHPEYHCDKNNNLINKDNRDKPPKEIIDATKMPNLDIAEMVADWFAMSEEKKSDPKEWADKNVNVRWKFSDDQKNIIYNLIENVWNN